MKKFICIGLILTIILSFVGCGEKNYTFKDNIENITGVEIVFAKNSSDYSVEKSLSDSEIKKFLEMFKTIEFKTYYFGDPMSVGGNAVKINYISGDYEIICYHWAEYIKDGEIYPIRKSCDEKEFNNLLNAFMS